MYFTCRSKIFRTICWNHWISSIYWSIRRNSLRWLVSLSKTPKRKKTSNQPSSLILLNLRFWLKMAKFESGSTCSQPRETSTPQRRSFKLTSPPRRKIQKSTKTWKLVMSLEQTPSKSRTAQAAVINYTSSLTKMISKKWSSNPGRVKSTSIFFSWKEKLPWESDIYF